MSSTNSEVEVELRNILPAKAHSDRLNTLLLDVRTPAEFEEVHIEGSVSVPLTELEPRKVMQLAAEKSSCLLICRSGNRARQAAEKLKGHGIAALSILEGGMQAWEASGLPVQRGQETISLERQVRIAAGSLVVGASLLGYFVSPAWIGLSAAVGAGLVFAGVTDTCGMAMLLARMPWNNRVSKAKEASGSI